jgi:hypothetical protein
MARELKKTPAVEVRWCKMLGDARPNRFDASKPNQWGVDIVLDSQEKEHLEWIEATEALFPLLHGESKKSNNWCPIRADKTQLAERGQPQRFYVAKFTLNQMRRRDGTTSEGPTVFDKDGRAWDHAKLIGNGSKMVIGYEVYPWPDKGTGAGLTLNCLAGQVTEWLEAPASVRTSASDFGFNQAPGIETAEEGKDGFPF